MLVLSALSALSSSVLFCTAFSCVFVAVFLFLVPVLFFLFCPISVESYREVQGRLTDRKTDGTEKKKKLFASRGISWIHCYFFCSIIFIKLHFRVHLDSMRAICVSTLCVEKDNANDDRHKMCYYNKHSLIMKNSKTHFSTIHRIFPYDFVSKFWFEPHKLISVSSTDIKFLTTMMQHLIMKTQKLTLFGNSRSS